MIDSNSDRWFHVVTHSTSAARVTPITRWRPCTGLDTVRAVIKQKAASSNIKSQLAMQCASVRPSDPGDWLALGSYTAVNAGETCTGDVAVDSVGGVPKTTDNFWVRFGLMSILASGTTGDADVCLQVSFDQEGEIVGEATADLTATYVDTETYVPVGPFVPFEFAEKVKMVTVLSGMVAATDGASSYADLAVKVAWRTAATSIGAPSAWSTTFSAGTNPQRTVDGEYDSNELTPTYSGTPMWVQFGLHYTKKTRSGHSLVIGTVSGNVQAMVAIRTS